MGLAPALKTCSFAVAYTGLFFHAVYCIQTPVCKSIRGKTDEEASAKTVESTAVFVKDRGCLSTIYSF